MIDPNQGNQVSDVQVELWTRSIESGIYVANFTLYGSTLSDTEGNFGFEVDNKNWSGMKLIFSKENYYGWEQNLNMDVIKNYHALDEDYQILSRAWVRFNVKNGEPFNNEDYFEFRIMNGALGCDSCCKDEKYQFTGMLVNQSFKCEMAGSQQIAIQYSTRKNNQQVFDMMNTFIAPFDTTTIDFLY